MLSESVIIAMPLIFVFIRNLTEAFSDGNQTTSLTERQKLKL